MDLEELISGLYSSMLTHLSKNKEFDNLCGLIYFTDGYGTYPTKPTPYKTAFAFLEDYNNREDILAWAMSVFWNADQE